METSIETIADLMASSGVKFGTSGARGLADAMTDRLCFAYTLGFMQFLADADQAKSQQVAIAGDFRPSTERILKAVAKALRHFGVEPIYCGRIPTPALAAFAMQRGMPSIMVTGSHIPDDRNGIKFNKPDGELLKQDEAPILAQQVALPDLFNDEALVEDQPLPEEDPAAAQEYVQRYRAFLPEQALAGMRVLVYEHSTVARDLLADIFSALGAEVVRKARSEVFVPVDTEAIRPEDVALAKAWAAEKVDLMVSADGDGDRPLVADEIGTWLRGDVTGIVTAKYLAADCVVTPVSSNTAVEKCAWFEQVLRTRIGSPYVVAAMQQAQAEGAQSVMGYEANGGFLLQSDVEREGRHLAALPTRDAVLVALAVAHSAKLQGVKVSELADALPARFTASDRIKAFPTELSKARLAAWDSGDQAQDFAAIEQAFPSLGKVSEVDQTDGVRVTFASNEIVHLRPSGNAPELRCYTEAHSNARAIELNQACLAVLATWRDER